VPEFTCPLHVSAYTPQEVEFLNRHAHSMPARYSITLSLNHATGGLPILWQEIE